MKRKVMIDGVIYTDHEIKELQQIIGEYTVARVASSADGAKPVTRFPSIPFEDGMTVERAGELVFSLPEYEEYKEPTDILDVVLEILTDEQAEQVPEAFHEWEVGKDYKVGDRVRYDGKLYKCVTMHTSQVGWEPDKAASLWARIGDTPEPGGIPEWVQPTGAQDAYAKGDHVMHDGKEWESEVDSNVWEPGVYGWAEV